MSSHIHTVEQSMKPTGRYSITQNLGWFPRGGVIAPMTTEGTMTVVEIPPCRKCKGNGSVPYRTTSYEGIVFNRHASEVVKEVAYHSTDGPPLYNYSWKVDCHNCVDGVPIPIPFTEVVPGTRAEMGIDHLI